MLIIRSRICIIGCMAWFKKMRVKTRVTRKPMRAKLKTRRMKNET